jgi:hypothetical protein
MLISKIWGASFSGYSRNDAPVSGIRQNERKAGKVPGRLKEKRGSGGFLK